MTRREIREKKEENAKIVTGSEKTLSKLFKKVSLNQPITEKKMKRIEYQ